MNIESQTLQLEKERFNIYASIHSCVSSFHVCLCTILEPPQILMNKAKPEAA
jgi:hypothetical protein